MKKCPSCKSDKSLDNYWKGQYSCIDCTKEKQKTRWVSRTPKKRLEQHLKYKYNVTIFELEEMLKEQDNKCSICKSKLPDLLIYEDRRRGYAIDHNHDTGKVRGILCLNCNTLLGMAKDNKDILLEAINYLELKGNYSNAAASRKKK